MFTLLLLAILILPPTLAFARDVAVGDSIVLGTGHALRIETHARVGMSSCWIAKRVPAGEFDHAVVDGGVNDAPGRCFELILDRLHARDVVVILPPAINSARAHMAAVARRRGLRTVSYVPGRDRLHPRSYVEVAASVRRAWK